MIEIESAALIGRAAFLGGCIMVFLLGTILGVVFLGAKLANMHIELDALKESFQTLSSEVEKMKWEREYVLRQNNSRDQEAESKKEQT